MTEFFCFLCNKTHNQIFSFMRHLKTWKKNSQTVISGYLLSGSADDKISRGHGGRHFITTLSMIDHLFLLCSREFSKKKFKNVSTFASGKYKIYASIDSNTYKRFIFYENVSPFEVFSFFLSAVIIFLMFYFIYFLQVS